MTISACVVRFDEASLWVDVVDGRTISVPLTWFLRLVSASAVELAQFGPSPGGILWDRLDEDISIAGLVLEGVT